MQQGTDESILSSDQLRCEDSERTLMARHIFLLEELVRYGAQVFSSIHDSFYHSIGERETPTATKDALATVRYVCP
jgi:hypothetical protein